MKGKKLVGETACERTFLGVVQVCGVLCFTPETTSVASGAKDYKMDKRAAWEQDFHCYEMSRPYAKCCQWKKIAEGRSHRSLGQSLS